MMVISLSPNLIEQVEHFDVKDVEYDPKRLIYVYKGSRRKVPEHLIRRRAAKNRRSHLEEMRAATTTLGKSKRIDVWARRMAKSIRDLHVQQHVLGRGGAPQMTRDDVQTIENELDYQIDRLARFANQLEAGDTSLGQAQARTSMYGSAGVTSFENGRMNAAIAAGKTMEENVLGVEGHCEECPRLTLMGRVAIGTLPRPGKRICMVNCKCHIEFF